MSCKAWLLRLATLNRNRDNTQVSSLSRGFSAAASLYAAVLWPVTLLQVRA